MKKRRALVELKIEVSHRCLLSCIHCSGSAGPTATRELGRSDVLRILDEAALLGVRRVDFSGGEPLIWSSIVEATSRAVAAGMAVSIYSSGNLPDAEQILRSVKKAGASRLVLSVFGASADTHDWVTRVGGSLQRSLEASRLAQEAGLQTEFHFVPMRRNWKDLPAVARLAVRLGIHRISILRLVPQGRAELIPNQLLTRVENIQLKGAIDKIQGTGLDVRTGSPYNFLGLSSETPCNSGVNRAVIDPMLRVFPCDALKGLSVQDLARLPEVWSVEAKSLESCWRTSPFICAVRSHLAEDHPEPCRSCLSLPGCGSGCLGQKVRTTGDFRKQPDPMCLRGKGVTH
jgi:radical SAM protein with 4Fe4S-binding SPASM domain